MAVTTQSAGPQILVVSKIFLVFLPQIVCYSRLVTTKLQILSMAAFCLFVAAFISPASAMAQPNYSFQDWCQIGGKQVILANLPSTTLTQQSFPRCTVTVYLSGTTTKASIFSDKIGTVLSNPFTANTDASFLFFAASGVPYDVTISGGGMPTPWTFVDICLACATGFGSGTVTNFTAGNLPPLFTTSVATSTTTPALSFNLSTVANDTFLANFSGSTGTPAFWTLVAGSNITLTPSGGNILTIAASGGGTSLCGPLLNDGTSTNCGNGNLANYPGGSNFLQAFGDNNLNNNTSTHVATLGDSNANNNQATQVVAIGSGNAASNQADNVVAIGNTSAAALNASSGDIVAIGDFAGDCTGTILCQDLVAIGDSAGNLTSGRVMVFIGECSGCNTASNDEVIAIGDGAAATTISSNSSTLNEVIAFGDGAGFSAITSHQSDLISIGQGSGSENRGNVNDIISMGDGAGANHATGSQDIVAIGDGAGSGVGSPFPTTPVVDMVAIGDAAAGHNAANDVVAVGDHPLAGGNLGIDNVGIGDHPLAANTTGAHNVAIGAFAGANGWTPSALGNSNLTGSNNTWIGDLAGPNTTSQLTNTIALGYHAFNTASNQMVLGNSSLTQAYLFGTGDGCLSSTGGLVTGSGSPCGSGGGGGAAFSAITGSTNTTANMVVGTGAALSAAGSGTIASTSVGGITVSGTPSTGQVLTATSTSAANWQSGATTPSFSTLSSGTNTTAAMLVGTGASLGVIGSGSIASTTTIALATTPTVCGANQYAAGVDTGGNAICIALPTQPASQYIAPQAISGCGVEYVTGLIYNVGACTYSINGVIYHSPLTTGVTLAPADPTNPRIDVIYVDTTQTVQTITGTPAVTPQQPVVDPSAQLELTFILVPAAATTPGNTTLVDIYLEGVEWTGAKGGSNGSRVNLTSTSNPFSGTHDTEFGVGGTVATTTFAGYTVPSAGTVNLANYNTLTFYIRNKAAWAATNSITIQWFNGTTQKGTGVVLSNGAFGFNSTTNTTTYQQISVPASTFGIAGVPVTSVRFTVSGTGAALTGFYLDQITLQGGSGGVILPTTLMNFKGTWSSTATYNPNDTVTSGGIGYVALTQNTNVAVSTTSTWAPLAQSAVVSSFSAPSASWPTWLVPTVSNPTSTPSLSVAASAIPYSALAGIGSNTVLGALTATTASALAMPSCSVSGTSALIWTTGVGFGCNAISGGGGGNTVSTSLTNNFLSKANGVHSIIDSGLQDDGTSLTYTGSGTINSMTMVEGTAASGVVNSDVLYTLSSSHRWMMNNNNAGALAVVGIGTAGTANDCLKLAANGIDIVDTGSPCGTGAGNVSAGGTLTNNAIVIGQGGSAVATISADTTTTHALFATAGTPAFRAIVAGDIPTLNQSTTGNAATATALSTAGTITTVLHGNAAGAPSFGAVANADLVNASTTVNGQLCTLGSTCTVTVSSLAFSGLSSATNTTAAMVVGTGASLTTSGSGTIAATSLVGNINGAAVPTSACALSSNGSNQLTALTCTGSGNNVLATSPTLVTPSLGAATATSLLASGNVDGTAPVTITTGTTATIGGTFKSGYTLNQEATAATAVAYTLPTAAAGLQYCVGNSWNGSAATTGVLTVNASASGQFIIFTDGTLSATGGNVTSGGAAADAACFVGVDATHWQQYTQRGTWTKH